MTMSRIIEVELVSEADCQNCGEILTHLDEIVYWIGDEDLPEGLYHKECYEAYHN